jgi:DNA mismatch repair protein MutH
MSKNPKMHLNEVKELLEKLDISKLEKPKKDKGKRGKELENILGIPNGTSLTDLEDGELKSYTMGETIAVTQLGHCLADIIDNNTDFEDTKVYKKMERVIYMAYFKDGTFKNWKVVDLKDNHEYSKKLKEDYEYISEKIKIAYENKKMLATITGPNNIIQIRTKASKNIKTNSYPKLIYNGCELKDKYMAFYICASYGKALMD